jgi:hypothetical protein
VLLDMNRAGLAMLGIDDGLEATFAALAAVRGAIRHGRSSVPYSR